MDFLHKDIEDEFNRWMQIIGPEDPYTSRYTVGLHDVLRAHFLIADFFAESDYGIGGIGPKDQNLLHSAIYRQFISFEGKDKWPGPYEKCATLMFGLIKDHPFHDANKRTALLVTLYQLDRLNRTPRVRQKEFENFVVEIADNRLAKYARFRQLSREEEDSEVFFIADFLKRNTRDIDRKHYTITFQQLNTLLGKYGFALSNPSGNYINVVRFETRRKYIIAGPKQTQEIRLAQIGFPGWKTQVSKGALKTVREATGLTKEKGYDSAVIFQGADPLHSLIDEYADPLRRLANR